jgi:deoxyribodipyrimidine photo-lyase
MRQLAREGWMHNRARLITASFLTKTLYLDWRLGAEHFIDLLVDADIANNNLNWQWVAGTGTDTRPNRILHPILQARRHDPSGDYVRGFIPELSDLPAKLIHEPHRLGAPELARRGYPPPLVDVAAAHARFRALRTA